VKAWIGFIAMCVGMFMAILDIQVVASSLTSIADALHIPADKLSWLQTGYLMAEVIAIPLTGWLTRAISLRWMFVGATAGFTLASLACASATSADVLIAIRVFQGFCGGMLIPAVFTSAFTLLPESHRVIATVFAGVFAMIAPTFGPIVGGYITQTYSWHWIFLINVIPGAIVSIGVALFIPAGVANWSLLRRIDYRTIGLAATFLAALELLLKEGPSHEWSGLLIEGLGVVCAISLIGAIYRCLRRPWPFVNLRQFKSRSFSLGCFLSFISGIGLFGSVYILAVFLGVVRGHSAFEIGKVMMVAGAVQLLTAPFVAYIETRVDARLLLGLGYGMFCAGLLGNGFSTYHSDFWALFWPQVLRGASVLLCILPATRLALDEWKPDDLPDASGMFNLMRNLGGAIGIALVDTIIAQNTKPNAIAIGKALQAGSPQVAREVGGLPLSMFHNTPMPPMSEFDKLSLEPLVTRAALVRSFNEAWLLIGMLFALALFALPFVKSKPWQPGKESPKVDAPALGPTKPRG
jgi:MFS transporter, DHA2 family, multidrug resistance protein